MRDPPKLLHTTKWTFSLKLWGAASEQVPHALMRGTEEACSRSMLAIETLRRNAPRRGLDPPLVMRPTPSDPRVGRRVKRCLPRVSKGTLMYFRVMYRINTGDAINTALAFKLMMWNMRMRTVDEEQYRGIGGAHGRRAT